MRSRRVFIASLGVLACLGLGACGDASPGAGAGYEYQDMVEPAAALTTPRYGHTATLLEDGRVLIAGGTVDNSINGFVYADTAEIYDPETGSLTSVPMIAGRGVPGALRLASGDVLVIGGITSDGMTSMRPLTTEIFRMAQGDFIEGPMLVGDKLRPVAMQREDGSVIVLAQDGAVERLASGATAFEALGGSPAYDYVSFVGFPLDEDRVLLLGGTIPMGDTPQDAPGGEIYDVQTQSFRDTGPLADRLNGTARVTRLDDGTLAVLTSNIQIFDPETETFRLGDFDEGLFLPTAGAAATLQDGRVVVAGGRMSATPTAELYLLDFGAGTVEMFEGLSAARWDLSATTLTDGRVFLAGGSDTVGNGPYSLTDVDLFY